MNSQFRHLIRALGVLVTAVPLTGCQYFADISNDFHDIFVGGYSRGGGVMMRSNPSTGLDSAEWGRGGGLEFALKATEFLYVDVGASEMETTEFGEAPLIQMFAHLLDRGAPEPLSARYRPNEQFGLRHQTYWEKSLGFPFATFYAVFSGHLPEPQVARRSILGRWYLHSTVRRHKDGIYQQRWLSRPRGAVPPAMGDAVRDVVLGTEGYQGLNSYFLFSPFFDSALPLLDRFEFGAEVNLHFFGVQGGISVGQILDLVSSVILIDAANDGGRRWWLLNLRDDLHRMTSPYEELPPPPPEDPGSEPDVPRHPLFYRIGDGRGPLTQ